MLTCKHIGGPSAGLAERRAGAACCFCPRVCALCFRLSRGCCSLPSARGKLCCMWEAVPPCCGLTCAAACP